MKVSLIIPVYNEAGHLATFLQKIDALALSIEKELVIVNDCSRDESWQIIQGFKFQSASILVNQPRNMGKGAAIQAGIAHATGDFIGVQDADFEYDIDDIPAVLEPLIQGKAQVVYGSRFKKSGTQVHRTFHYLVNRFLTMLSDVLSGLYLSDMETCYKFFRADVIKNIKLVSQRFGIEPEITARIARLKLRIVEVPISYFPRNYLEGKKITWKDGVAAVRHIIWFNVLDRRWREAYLPSMPKAYIPSGKQWL